LEVEVEEKSWSSTWDRATWAGWSGCWSARWGSIEGWKANDLGGGTPHVSLWRDSAEQKENVKTHPSEKPLRTATATIEPVRVQAEIERVSQRTPPGLSARSMFEPRTLGPGCALGVSQGTSGEEVKHRGGCCRCTRCGRSTTRRCALCMETICQECRSEHDELDCEAVTARVCVVCGAVSKTNACERGGTWFCCRHRDHECPTPQPGERAACVVRRSWSCPR
jgi:hypothetical protein